VNAAVREGIGGRAGDWRVVVYQLQDFPALAVRIEEPEELRFN
jgi:hypothetical protein